MNALTPIKISQEARRELWIGIEKYFRRHSNPFISSAFKANCHDIQYQNSLSAAAISVIYVAKVVAYHISHGYQYEIVFRDEVNRGRTDSPMQAELKVYLINNFINPDLTKEQLNECLAVPMRGFNINPKSNISQFSDVQIKRFRDILGEYKMDYINIFENKDFMNEEYLDESK